MKFISFVLPEILGRILAGDENIPPGGIGLNLLKVTYLRKKNSFHSTAAINQFINEVHSREKFCFALFCFRVLIRMSIYVFKRKEMRDV